MPARRVIIVGIHRGRDEVETYNITQMIGRSGRLGIDPRGDAYILLPNSEAKKHRDRLNTPQKITSKILDKPRNLAFHLVSEIHHEDITNFDQIKVWFERSLAYFQNRILNQTYLKELFEELIKREIVHDDEGVLSASSVGRISSIFYYSPFDVADLRRNFYFLFLHNKHEDDMHVALALAKTDTHRSVIVNNAEKQELRMFDQKLQRDLGVDYKYITEGIKKTAFCYQNLMNGRNSGSLSGFQRGLQIDFERMEQILVAMDSMSGKWGKETFMRNLAKRIRHGVPSHLVDLCQLPNVGKVRAKKLYDMGYKGVEDIVTLGHDKVKSILNMKEAMVGDIIKEALRISSL